MDGQNIIDYIQNRSGIGSYGPDTDPIVFPAGMWTPKYREAKSYAESANLPFLAVATKPSDGCEFCGIFHPKIMDSKFLQWAKSKNVILGMFEDKNPDKTDKDWVDWVAGNYTGYPFVRLYWKKRDGSIVDDHFMGRNSSIGDIDKDGKPGTVDDLIARLDNDIFEDDVPIDVHGDGNIANEISDVSKDFITGQWYRYSTDLASFEAFIEYARQSKKPVIVLGSAFGCDKCGNFTSNILTKNEAKTWLATSGCLLLHVYSGSGWWTTKPLKLFLDVFNEGKSGSLPMINVWKDGNLLLRTTYPGGTWETYKEKFEAVIGKDEDPPQPDPSPSKKYQIDFDANGGSGSLASIEVGEGQNAVLPSLLEVTSTIFKRGFNPTNFQDRDTGKEYQFGDIILSVQANMTLLVVFEKIEDNKKDEDEDEDDNKDDKKKKFEVKGKTQTYVRSKFPLKYQYSSTGIKTIRISDNLSNLVVRGDSTIPNAGMESQIIYAKFNTRLSAVPDYCFANCTNLAELDSDNHIKSVGDYSFYNCKSLKSANFLGNANKVLTYIGDYAFAGSGLSSVIINLQGSISNSSTNTHCFADCKELTSVDMTNSTYLADHMFDGCSKLQKVHLNNYHSYINEYAFANCTTLTSMTFPQKTYMLPDHMFDGCTNLVEVKFQEPSDLKYIGKAVFGRCQNLTSITLPKSVDSLEYIDPEFLSGSSIDKVVFKGIDDNVFADEIKEAKEYALPPSVLYENASKIKTILNDVLTNNIPVIAIRSNDNGCSICNTYKEKIYGTGTFKKWLTTKNKYYWVLAYHDSNTAGFNAINNFQTKYCHITEEWWLGVGFYWKKEDGTVVTKAFDGSTAYSGAYSTIDKYIDQLENHVFKGYEGEGEIIYVTKDEITTFGRGQDLSVTFVSSTGREWICANDSVIYIPETRVDHHTTSNFKYGIWYHNIKELKAFADSNHLPLLLEFGSKGCDPCKDFKKNTFNNSDFQEQITSKPCLLSKIEIGNGESFNYPTTTQAYYASHDFGDPNTLIPQLVFYWNKSSGEIYKKIWNYNYRSDPGNANYQSVLKKLDEMLGSYQGDSRFIAPSIMSFQNGKYKYYQRDSVDDLNGKYFICDKKTSIQNFSGNMVLETGNILTGGVKEKVTLTSISMGDTINVANGAYQYFTVDAKSRYYDLSGIIFTIDDHDVVGLCQFENEVSYQYDVEDTSDFGYWVHFSDSSNEDSLQNLISLSESKDYPTIFLERPATVEAIAVSIPKTGSGDQETTTVRIDISLATSRDKIESLVAEALGASRTLKSITNIDDLAAIQKFYTQVCNSSSFTNWAKKKKYVLVDIASDSWTSGAPKKMREFESSRNFDGNSISDPLPKFLVYLACSSCTTDGSLLIECKKKVNVDYSKNIDHYTQLIESYIGS